MGKKLMILLAALALALVTASPAFAGDDDKCPNLDTGRIEVGGEQTEYTYSAPAGYLVNGYCVKAGSANQGDGPKPVDVNPPSKTVVIEHPSGKAISHFSVSWVPEDPSGTTTTTVAPPETTTTTEAPPEPTTTTTTEAPPPEPEFGQEASGVCDDNYVASLGGKVYSSVGGFASVTFTTATDEFGTDGPKGEVVEGVFSWSTAWPQEYLGQDIRVNADVLGDGGEWNSYPDADVWVEWPCDTTTTTAAPTTTTAAPETTTTAAETTTTAAETTTVAPVPDGGAPADAQEFPIGVLGAAGAISLLLAGLYALRRRTEVVDQ